MVVIGLAYQWILISSISKVSIIKNQLVYWFNNKEQSS